MKVHEALSAVMADVQAVGKGGKVDIKNGPKYSFRGVDAVVNAVGPALRSHGVVVLPRVLDRQYEAFTTSSGGTQRNCVAEVEYTFVGPEGDVLVCSAVGEASDSGDKATPKAMSVAYRTALLQALCIPTDEPDPDEHVVERAGPDQAVVAAQRTLLAHVKTTLTDLDDEGAAKKAREVWDAHGQDPKRLNEMIGAVQ